MLKVTLTKHRGFEDSLTRNGFEELERAVENAEASTHQWKDGELQLWGRLVSKVYRFLDLRRFMNLIRRTRWR